MLNILLSVSGLPAVKSTWESILELLGVIVVFLIVVVACYYTTKFVAGRQLKSRKGSNIEVIETYTVAQNKFIQLLRIGTKYVVISVAKDNITLLTELKEDELVFNEEVSVPQVSFKDVLKNIVNKTQNGSGDDSASENKIEK
ncbi:MAG: flagellar biosynthetic protein FliO [Lachnospiraceae bacterium]|nr:flagellar biosynthetic protein FliO [Lachnospiraceae bacterium]